MSTNHKTELYFDFDKSGFLRWRFGCILDAFYTHTHTYTPQQKVTLIECYSISDAAPSEIEEGGDGRMSASAPAISP